MDYYKKKYDEAIERARKLKENPQSVFNEYSPKEGDTICDYIFPELRESENDKIREQIIYAINKLNVPESEKNKLLAWLEKQGEQKPTLRERYKNIAESEWFKKTHEGMSVSDDEKVDNVNKIEPKFKVGDWVINRTNATIMQIINNKDFYESVEIGGQRRIDYYNYLEWDFRLWTIQDAKDGDILCTPNGNTFIFKTIDGDKILDYCGLYFNKFFSDSGSPNGSSTHYDKCNYHPATKEQRDLLFKKMHEAGYEWDADKKELKKIEDEEYNGEDYGIDGLWHAMNILEKTLGKVNGYQTDDGFLSHQCAITAVKKLYKQKPAWSEEDEFNFKLTLRTIELDQGLSVKSIKKLHSWLKSIKQRIGGKL